MGGRSLGRDGREGFSHCLLSVPQAAEDWNCSKKGNTSGERQTSQGVSVLRRACSHRVGPGGSGKVRGQMSRPSQELSPLQTHTLIHALHAHAHAHPPAGAGLKCHENPSPVAPNVGCEHLRVGLCPPTHTGLTPIPAPRTTSRVDKCLKNEWMNGPRRLDEEIYTPY